MNTLYDPGKIVQVPEDKILNSFNIDIKSIFTWFVIISKFTPDLKQSKGQQDKWYQRSSSAEENRCSDGDPVVAADQRIPCHSQDSLELKLIILIIMNVLFFVILADTEEIQR